MSPEVAEEVMIEAMRMPSAGRTLKAGWFEILVASVGLYIWALAMPGGWVDFGKSELFLPALIVGGTSLVICSVATLLNRRG